MEIIQATIGVLTAAVTIALTFYLLLRFVEWKDEPVSLNGILLTVMAIYGWCLVLDVMP